MITRIDNREDYGEDRWIGLGVIKEFVIVIAYSEPKEETTRLISIRKANKNESKNYHTQIKNELE